MKRRLYFNQECECEYYPRSWTLIMCEDHGQIFNESIDRGMTPINALIAVVEFINENGK